MMDDEKHGPVFNVRDAQWAPSPQDIERRWDRMDVLKAERDEARAWARRLKAERDAAVAQLAEHGLEPDGTP